MKKMRALAMFPQYQSISLFSDNVSSHFAADNLQLLVTKNAKRERERGGVCVLG